MSGWIRLRAASLGLDLAPEVGGSVARFTVAGQDILRAAPEALADALDAACFPLVPFCNRVRDGRFGMGGQDIRLTPNLPGQKHPLHGQGWRAAWSVERAGADQAELSFRHAPGEWPWAYEARQTFRLDAQGLSYSLTARNLSDRPMPCGLGLHPYFPCDGETVLDAPVQAVWTIDDEIMPLERVAAEGRYSLDRRRICGAGLDNGYDGWSGRASLKWPGRSLEMTSPQARRFQVYAPAEGGVVVAEPVTNANAALNRPEGQWESLGLSVLAPGAAAQLYVRLAVRMDSARVAP